MSTIYISEYVTIGVPGPEGSGFQAPKEPAIAEQKVSISGSPTASAAFQPTTRMVRIATDATCSILFGPSPIANTGAKRLAANQTEYFAVNAGDKVSVILNA